MPKKNQDQQQFELERIRKERNMVVARSVSLIQHARYSLSLQEQRFLLYCISKVRPTDDVDAEYTIDLKDFLAVCGLRGSSSYDTIKNEIMASLLGMRFQFEDVHDNGDVEFKAINWFSSLSVLYKKDHVYSSTVSFQFTQPVAKLLTGLAAYNRDASRENRLYYIADELTYMLPFRCRYSHYLYPLLRSYQNRNEWTFAIEGPDGLRNLLDVYEREGGKQSVQDRIQTNNARIDEEVAYFRKNARRRSAADAAAGVQELPHARKMLYPKFSDFRKHVLDPAVEDINTFSNIKVAYRALKTGRSVTHVTFIYEDKDDRDKRSSEHRGQLVLDRNDEYTTALLQNVRGVENPLEFTEAPAGESTTPKSVKVKPRQKPRPGNGMSARELTDAIQADIRQYNESRPDHVVNLGKHKKRKYDMNGRPMIDVCDYFPTAPLPGDKHWGIRLTEEQVAMYTLEVPGVFDHWKMHADMTEFYGFLTAMTESCGAKRLKQYMADGKLQLLLDEEEELILFDAEGRTPIVDAERFLRKVLADPELVGGYFEDYQKGSLPLPEDG